MRISDFAARLTALEGKLGVALDTYLLRSGERATLPKNQRLAAFSDVLHRRPSERARIMLQAQSTSGPDRLFELAQAIHASGPACET
jgi:hypothetical protein